MFHDVFKGKRVLITGHTGFKGSWLSEWLIQLGAEVAGFSKYIPTHPSHFEVLHLSKRLKDFEGDICDREQLGKVFHQFQPEVLFHLAAQPIVSESIAQPVETFQTNVLGFVNVLEQLRSSPSVQAAVMITSDKCYENVEWEYGYREDDRLGGKDPYSASKACAEAAFHSYFRTFFKEKRAKNIQLATGRAGNVIGGGDWAKDRIVPDCVKAWSESEQPLIRSPQATRPWQHVLEPLSGYLLLAMHLLERKDRTNGESFNFGPPANVNATVAELLTEMKKTWPQGSWRTDPSSVLGSKESGLLKLCWDKALTRLNWVPNLTFEETVSFTAHWYKSFYESSSTGTPQVLTTEQIQAYCRLAQERKRSWAER